MTLRHFFPTSDMNPLSPDMRPLSPRESGRSTVTCSPAPLLSCSRAEGARGRGEGLEHACGPQVPPLYPHTSTLNAAVVVASCSLKPGTWSLLCLLLLALSLPSSAAETALAGRVLDPDGNGVPAAAVTFYDVEANWLLVPPKAVARVESAADGSYSISGMISETTAAWRSYGMLIVEKNGLALGWANFLPDATEADVVLQRPSRLAGIVVDEAGKPLSGVAVRALLIRTEGEHPSVAFGLGISALERRTDAQGRFSFDTVPPDVTAELIVSAPGFATTTAGTGIPGAVLSLRPPRDDITVDMAREGRVAGRVADEAGAPCAGVAILAKLGNQSPFLSATAVSDADGRFAIGGLGAGDWSLSVAPATPTDEDLLVKPVVVAVKSGETAEVPLIAEAGGALEVRAVDAENGAPIADVRVSPRPTEGVYLVRPLVRLTDVEGIARFRMTPSTYLVYVPDERYKQPPEPIYADVTSGQTTRIVLNLERADAAQEPQ